MFNLTELQHDALVDARYNLARTHDQLDEPAEARRHRQEAHDIFQEIGDPQAAEMQDPVRT